MKNTFSALFLFILLTLTGTAPAQQNNARTSGEVKAVSNVDLKRYSGKWYEIAKYPNDFQKKCVGNTTATYNVKTDGTLEVVNQCLKKDGTIIDAKGKAKIVDAASNAKLKVRFAPGYLSFLPAVWGDYWILELDDNYQYAVVGDPDREYLWILSRTPEMKEAVYQNLQRRVETMGFNPGNLTKTPQNAEAIKGAVIRNQ